MTRNIIFLLQEILIASNKRALVARKVVNMTIATLDTLTPELFDIVLETLELGDIRQLRLANKETCSRATQDRFLASFARKEVKLTRSGLEAFAHMTSQGRRLGCLVQHLTLEGVLHDPSKLKECLEDGDLTRVLGPGTLWNSTRTRPRYEAEIATAQKQLDEIRQCQSETEELREAGKDLVLLSQALRDVASHSRNGLDTLCLKVMIHDGVAVVPPIGQRFGCPRRDEIFRTAARTFTLVAMSLRESRLPVGRLEVFDEFPEHYCCNLPYDTFSQLDWAGPEHHWLLFRALKTCSLRISDRFMGPASDTDLASDTVSHDRSLGQELEIDAGHRSALLKMLSMCPELETLRLTWYRMSPQRHTRTYRYRSGGPQSTARQNFMRDLALATPFPLLHTLHLGGLNLRAKDFLAFVQKHQSTLREFSLHNIKAVNGRFAPIFALLARPDTQMQRIQLEDLHEDNAPVRYKIQQRSSFTHIDGDEWDNIIERWGEDAKKQVEYTIRPRQSLSTPERYVANQRRRLEFGYEY
jgi:hypothetical protein